MIMSLVSQQSLGAGQRPMLRSPSALCRYPSPSPLLPPSAELRPAAPAVALYSRYGFTSIKTAPTVFRLPARAGTGNLPSLPASPSLRLFPLRPNANFGGPVLLSGLLPARSGQSLPHGASRPSRAESQTLLSRPVERGLRTVPDLSG